MNSTPLRRSTSPAWPWPVLLSLLGACHSTAIPEPARAGTHLPLESIEGLEALDAQVEAVAYRGRKGVRVVEEPQGAGGGVVLLPAPDLRDGTIELELSGRPHADAAPNMRGFVGVAFRLRGVETRAYDCFYLRPTNGRAEEQLRRNHSTQYVAHPEFPWHRLRAESPGVYESYADLVPGEWTRVRIVVRGSRAELYLHGNEQPVLVVPELLGGDDGGAVALWIGTGTEAHFRNVRISAE